ncbi:MAG TPA: hypothetical protein VKB93_14825 [Thermoanaerobaculia bacterium]|nr:hypothetical protein [Thermoanaerobaculia bacterium]
MSFDCRNLVAGLTLALLLLLAPAALATDYYADPAGGPWTSSSTWHLLSNSGPAAPAGTYPGSAAGDKAIIDFQGITVTLNAVVPNAVTLEASNVSCFVTVNAGGVLPLTGSSFIAGGTILNLSGGTITNAGLLDIRANSGFTFSSGTLTGSGTTQISTDPSLPAQLTISGGVLDAHTLNLNGKAKYTGTWTINNGATVNISGTGIFDIQSLGAITGTGGGQINNSGKVEKTSGAGGTNIVPPLNNNNLVKVSAGDLVMNGTHTNGTFDIIGGSKLELAGTISGTCTGQGAGAINIVSALTLNAGAVLDLTNLQMAGGALQGPVSGTGMANVSGMVNFVGGVWTRNLLVDLAGTSTLNFPGTASATISNNARVDNSGTINVSPGAGLLAINSGGYIQNNNALNLVGDVTINSDNVNNPHIDNASGATILKTAGAGVATFNVNLSNDGIVQSNSGGIKFTKSGTHTGSFKICDACTFEFAGGTHVLDGALMQYLNFNGNPVVKLSAGVFDIPTSAQISTNYQFIHTGGQITGDGTLAVFAAYIWSGGAQLGNGETQLASYSHMFNGAIGPMVLQGRDMLINGTVTYGPAPTNWLTINLGSVLTNAGGTFTMSNDMPILSDGSGVIENNGGTWQKTGGSGKAAINAQFNNINPVIVGTGLTTHSLVTGATLNVTSGQLALNGGGTSNGSIFVPNADNAVSFENAVSTYTLAAGTTTNPADLGVISINFGTLTLAAPLSLKNVEFISGRLGGADLTITNKMKWTGGMILGPGGTTTIAATATLTRLPSPYPAFLDNRTLQLDGTTDFEGDLLLQTNAVINNNGTFNARDGAMNNGPGANAFNNNATLKKMAGVTGMRFNVPVNNIGTVSSEVSGQSLIFARGGTNDAPGALTTTGTALIDFFGGTFNVNGGTLSGTGQHRVNGGTLKINANLGPPAITLAVMSGALDIASSMTFQVNSLLFTGGTVNGPGTLRAFGGLIGALAPTTLANGATLTIPAPTFSYDASNVNYLTIADTSKLNVESGAFFGMSGNGTIFGSAPASLTNSGTIRKTAGGGFSIITVPITSSLGSIGTVNGFLALKGGGTISTPIETTGGMVDFALGTFSLDPGVSITGNGLIAVQSGTVNVNTALTIPKFDFSGGTIGGAGALTVGDTVWSFGTFDGSGTLTILAASVFNMAGPGVKTLNRALTSNGTFAASGGALGGTGTILINPSGSFNRNIADTLSIAPAFTNNGSASFTGTTTFTGGYTQTGGQTALLGATLASPSTIQFNGGLVKGNGILGGSVAVNGATVSPGLSPGTIMINGNYSQSPTSTLNIELGGTAPGTGYDQLIVTGSATLAGTVNVTLINGFTLSSGDVFDAVTYAAHSGVFAPENLPPFPGGTFASTYTPSAYELAATVPTPAELAVTKTGPASAKPGSIINYTITVKNNGDIAAPGVIVADPTPQGLTFLQNSGDCTTAFPCSLGTLAGGATRTIVATYKVGFIAGTAFTNTATLNVTDADNTNNKAFATTSVECQSFSVTGQPTGSAGTSGTLTWSGTTAQLYEVFLGPKGSGCTTSIGKTLTNSFHYSGLAPDTEYEWRIEATVNGCPTVSSDCVSFKTTACSTPEVPLARVIGEATSTKSYAVEWDVVPGAVRYEVDEATSLTFADATTTVVNQGTSATFAHDASEPKGYFYRVRGIADCQNTPGPYSLPIRVVIVPPPAPTDKNPVFNIPVGSQTVINHKIFIPGDPAATLFFTAHTDREWLHVTPESGALPPQGVLLDVTIEPGELPNGTFTATVIVEINAAAGSRLTTHGTTVSTAVSVNLVTPVTPISSKTGPSQYSLVIPAAGHLKGIDSEWQSDVRLTNAGFKPYRYRVTFTPAAGTAGGVKQTDVKLDAGSTMALDDIVKTWFGFGSLGDGESGQLEIVPLDEPQNASLVTVAASRTYNVTANGTLGQFIPAVPFPSFIGRVVSGGLPTVLSLQQLAQSSAFRTNVGIVESAGRSASAVVSIFNATGIKLLDLPQTLAAGQQLQLNALLAQNNITLSDGRAEVRVTGGDGKVTAYASIVDNGTGDPFLVSGTPLAQTGTTKYVLPGAANTNTGFADWRTDMRIFNYGSVPQTATLTFYPMFGGAPKTAEVLAKVGEVLALDNVVKTLFGGDNLSGAVHITTPQPASFIVSGRTYNQTAAGTLGQFIPAVTVDQAVGNGGRALQILQVEDSARYRTNIGITEVTGKPATVEIQIVLPDSKITPVVQLPLAANEVRQFNVIRDLALGNVYNGRVSVRVISGEGRVTAYGSLIDELTGDPAFIQGQ